MEKVRPEIDSRSAGAVSAEPILAWRVHLVRREPMKAALIAPLVIGSLAVSYLMFRSLLFPAIALFLFVSALSDYLFPIRYEITRDGAACRTLVGRTGITWDRVRKYYLDDCGIKLSPLPRPGRLEAYRGVYLRFGGNRDEVIEAVRRMRDAARSTDG